MTELKTQNEPSRTLELEGWKRQFIAREPRLTEAVQIYKNIGFEVKLESLPKVQEGGTCPKGEEEGEGECQACFKGIEHQYKIIYTRPASDDRDQKKAEFSFSTSFFHTS